MLLIRLWNFIKGYVIIIVEGYFLEKFINICIHRQIFLWHIKRIKSKEMTLKVSVKGFKLLRPVCRKTRCRVRIIRKKGLPFILSRYKKRKAFVAGAVIFIFILYGLTSFIWAVEIEGNERIAADVLREKLAMLGAKPGVFKYTVDTDKIVDSLMMDINELAWIGVSLRGTKIKVKVVERKPAPELIARDVPCDVVAEKDGVIKMVIAKEGKTLVKEGETVSKGQVLIGGRVDSKVEGVEPRYVHAMGEVIARTWYEESKIVENFIIERVRTGKVKNRYSLILFNKRISLFFNNSSYENYDKIDIIKSLGIGEDAVLPFGIHIEKFYEVRLDRRELDEEEARQLAANYAYDAALRKIAPETKIIGTNVSWKEEEGKLYAVVVVECEEDIGIQRELGGM